MLMRRAPIAKKRAAPRRNEGRVQHGRVKARQRFATDHVKRYWETLERKCVACGRTDATVIHHILAPMAEKMRKRDHRFVVILCPDRCHNFHPDSIHGLGSEAKFLATHGIDLIAIARTNWSNFNG